MLQKTFFVLYVTLALLVVISAVDNKVMALESNSTLANATSALSTSTRPPQPPSLSPLDNQTIIAAALNVPEIKSWSSKWQFAGMDFNGTANPVTWKQAIVTLYSPPDASTPLKCTNGWTARVQVDLNTKQVLHAWYPTKASLCNDYAELKKIIPAIKPNHVTAKSNPASLTPSTNLGFSETTQQDVSSNTYYGNAAILNTPTYSSNIFKDMDALVGFSLNGDFNSVNGFAQAGWIMTDIPGCSSCGVNEGAADLVYVDESISGMGDAAVNIGYTWVNNQQELAYLECGTSYYAVTIQYGSNLFNHNTNIPCSAAQINDVDNNSIWFENQNTIYSSYWYSDITSSQITASGATEINSAKNVVSWGSSNNYDRTGGIDQSSSVISGSVTNNGAATWSSLSNVPLYTDSNDAVWVASQDSNNNPISGYYVTATQGGTLITSGYTPVLFENLNGGTYNITPTDYGSYHFNYWKYTGDYTVPKSVTPGSSISTLVAIYSTTAVTITAQDQNGNSLSMYTTLYLNGNPVRTGFTPITFGLVSGQTYSVAVGDYSPYFFNYWQDTSSQTRSRSFTLTGTTDPTYTAVFSTTSVQITANDTSGSAITGYYVPLSQGGTVVKQGYTPATFGLTSGSTYSVSPNDYTEYFNHWHDAYNSWDGSRTRTFTLTGPTSPTYNAVYYTSQAQGFEITATDWDNNPLNGYYVPISPCGGDNQCSAFIPAWFTYLYSYPSYTVSPNDYGNYYFDHWQDTGNTTRARTIAPSTSLHAYNAVYRICELIANPNHHCYALENGTATTNYGNQFNTTVTNIQPSNCSNFVDIEQWDVFLNGDWVEQGFTSGTIQNQCITNQVSFHADSIGGQYAEVNDGTVHIGSNQNYTLDDPGHDGNWYALDNGTSLGAMLGIYTTASYAQVGIEDTDPSASIPKTYQSQIQYLVGSGWQYWSNGTFLNDQDPPVWIINCTPNFQKVSEGSGTMGSC